MKLYKLFFIFIFLISCSKEGNKEKPSQKQENPNIETQWNLSSIEVGNLDFGLVPFDGQKILTINIINDGTEPISDSVILDGSDFTLLFNSCLNLEPLKRCQVRISFNAQDKLNDIYTANLSYGPHINTITAYIDRGEQIPDKTFTSNGINLTQYNFGNIEHRHNLLKTIVVRNTGKVPLNNQVSLTTNNAFQKVYDSCSDNELKSGRNCLVKIFLKGQGNSGSVSTVLSYGDDTIPLEAYIKSPQQLALENSEFIFIYNNHEYDLQPIDLQTLNLNEYKEFRFSIKNIGSSPGFINSFSLDNHFNIFFNNCNQQWIEPSKSCFLRAFLTPQNKGMFSTNILADVDYQINSQSVQWTVRSPGDKIECTNEIEHALLANITYNGANYSNCVVEQCVPTHRVENNSCVANVISCQVVNGTGNKTWDFESNSYGECIVTACDSDRYENVNNQCRYIIPIVENNSHTLNEDSSILNQNFNYSASSPVSFEIISGVNNGILTVVGSQYSYTPNLNYNGLDSFTYRVNDGMVNSEIATVSFTVNGVNDIPVANNQNLTILEDNVLNINLTGTDVDNDILTYEITTYPTNGVLIVNGNNVVYTPSLNYTGVDSFSFVAKDSSSQSLPAVVSITVNPVNDAPVALTQTLGIVEETSRSFTLQGSDAENSNLTYSITQQPSVGTITGTAPNLVYNPPINFSGDVTMKFKVSDGQLDSSEVSVIFTNNLINKNYLNERIGALETRYRNKGYNITLPRIVNEEVSSADINAVSSVINSLNLTDTTSSLISTTLTSSLMNAAFNKHFNIRQHCNSFTSCYENKNIYNRAIYGTNILTVQNNLLWDSVNSRYLGTKCEAWYSTSEIAWADRKLDSTKTNYLNNTYADNTTNNRYLTVFNQNMPTCGSVYYTYNQGCRSYGYVYITIAGVQYPAASMGNGGCASGSGTVNFNKGAGVHIGSHYFGSATLRTGY